MPYMTPAGLAKLAALGVSKADLESWQTIVGTGADGDPGPFTFAATVRWFRDHGYMKPPELPTEYRSRVVAIARAELGIQDPQKYIRDAAPMYVGLPPNAKAWCGIFALWCYRQAGLTDKKWVDRLGFAEGYLPHVFGIPEPGDLAYYERGQHYAIVERVADGYVYTIDGNAKTAPLEGVETRRRPITEAKGYYSIRNLAP